VYIAGTLPAGRPPGNHGLTARGGIRAQVELAEYAQIFDKATLQ
jgi:hypothetical protein